VAAHFMKTCRIRLTREVSETGRFEWALLDESGAVLEQAASDLGMPPSSGQCEVVLASEMVLLERVAVPAAQQRRVHSALRFLAEDSVIPDPARIHVAAEAAPQKNAMCIGIVDRQWFAHALARLQRVGLSARSAYPECLLAELTPRAWIVVWNGADSFARVAEAEGFALDSAAENAVPAALLLALEGARSSARTPERIVLRTTPGIAPPDMQRWSKALGIPVEPGAPWHWAQAERSAKVDFMQGEFRARGAAEGWQHRLWRPALLASALLLVGSAGIAAEWAAKVSERNRLLAEMSAIYRESFGNGAVVLDASLQMSRAVAEQRLRAGQGAPTDFVPLLGVLADRLLDPAEQSIEAIAYEEGVLSVSLRSRNSKAAGGFAEALRAKAAIPGMDVRIEEDRSGGLLITAIRRTR
jgi:type II secretion system protein L